MGKPLIIRNRADFFFPVEAKLLHDRAGQPHPSRITFFDAAFKASSATALRDSAHFLQKEMFIYRCLQCIINDWNYCTKAHSCSSVMMNPQSPGDHMIPWLYFEIISLGKQNCIYFFFLSSVNFQIRGMGKCLQEIFYKLGWFFILNAV